MKLSSNMITMIVTLITWIGVFLYLLRLDRKVSRIEKNLKRG
jgi:CcmD family protein